LVNMLIREFYFGRENNSERMAYSIQPVPESVNRSWAICFAELIMIAGDSRVERIVFGCPKVNILWKKCT
jgi:hypothetical protein